MTQGHIVVVEWYGGTRAIRSCVSLFNCMTYEIALCQNFNGLWRPIESGHLFDWESRSVVALASSRRSFLHPVVLPMIFAP